MTTDQPAIPRPLREILADQFLGLAKASGGYTAAVAKDGLYAYVSLSEDIITQQAKMLRDDTDELAQLSTLQHQLRHQKAQVLTLRAILDEVIAAVDRGDLGALDVARTALAATS
jgi:cell division protein FtsB